MRLRGRTSAFGLAVVLATATAMADTVVTAREVIAGSIQTADSSFVRLKMPGGGIRMLVTSDVYELRFSDPGRIEDFSILLPKVKVVLDSGQPIAFRAQGTSGLEPQPVDSVGAARRRELEREGFSRGILSAPLQAVAASGGGCGLAALGGWLLPASAIPAAAGCGSAGCLGGLCVGRMRPSPPAADTAASRAYMRGYNRGIAVSSAYGLLMGALTVGLVTYVVAFSASETGR